MDFTLDQIQQGFDKAKPVPDRKVDKPDDSYSLDQVQEGFKKIAIPTKQAPQPENSPATQLLIDHRNALLAAAQKTTPIMAGHQKNYVGEAEVYDDGSVYYRGEDGKLIPTDPEKHVVLQDPIDSKHKVFNRSKDTNEGTLAGIARLITGAAVTSPIQVVRAGTAGVSGTSKVLEAADRIQTPIPRAALSNNPVVHTTARVVSHLPGGAGPLERGAENMATGLENAAGRAAEIPTGVVSTPEIAGSAAKTGLNETIRPGGALTDKVKAAYDKVDSMLPTPAATKNAALDNTRGIAGKIQTEFEATRKEGIDPTLNEVINAVTHPDGVNYVGLKRLIHNVGEMISTGKIPEGMDAGNLKRLYGSLKDDMREFLLQRRVDGSVPPDAGARVRAWEQANKVAAGVAARREQLAKVLGLTTDRSDEAVFHALMRAGSSGAGADAKLLNMARRSMNPDAWAEVQSAVTNKMGWRVGKGGEHFDPQNFMKDYDGLSDKAKDAFFGPAGSAHRQAIEDIKTVTRRFPQALDLSHRTGEVGHLLATGAALHEPSKLAGVMGTMNIFSRALAKPATAKSLATWAKRYENYALAPGSDARRRQLASATDQFAQVMGRDIDSRKETQKNMATVASKVITPVAIAGHIAKWLWDSVEQHH